MTMRSIEEARVCFVNCGLPEDQCACYRQMMVDDPEAARIVREAADRRHAALERLASK